MILWQKQNEQKLDQNKILWLGGYLWQSFRIKYNYITSRMKKPSVSLNSQYPNQQQLFLQDPKSDLYILVKQKIYPLHKSFLADVPFFQTSAFAEKKVHVILEEIDIKWLDAVLAYFYGKKLEFDRDWELCKLMKTVKFLGISNLNRKIHAELKDNFDQYGLFLLMQISNTFNLRWLRQMCDQQLTLMNFEQLNYNRYDLLQVQREVLQDVLKFHELLKINRNIVGQNGRTLKKIVTQYCLANKIDLAEVQNILLHEQSTLDQIKEQEYEGEIIRKRKGSEPQNSRSEQKNQKLTKSVINEIDNHNVTEEQEKTQETPVNQEIKVRVIAYGSNPEGNNMQGEVTVAKEVVRGNVKEKKSTDLDSIDESFKKFEKVCKQQDQKFLSLKKEMERLSVARKSKSGTKQRQRTCSPSISEQNTTKISEAGQKRKERALGEIPKLSKQ